MLCQLCESRGVSSEWYVHSSRRHRQYSQGVGHTHQQAASALHRFYMHTVLLCLLNESGKGKVNRAPLRERRRVLISLFQAWREPGEPLMSVMRDQCDARPMVTLPAARHHRPLAGTKLYCLMTEARVCLQLAQGCTRQRGGRDSNPRPVDHKSSILTTQPQSHTMNE